MAAVVLSGGVGGAKLVLGLSDKLEPDQLTVIANIGDDFEHFGLPVCTDLDTLMYTLSGAANPETGWGIANESWQFMDAVAALGGETWFRLGDRDIATHARRLELLRSGCSLSEATRQLLDEADVAIRVWPASDQPVRTKIQSESQVYDFQDYFVRLQAQPVAHGFEYAGAEVAAASPGAVAALRADNLTALVITPSNPWLSIDPILAIPELKATIRSLKVPRVAISPIVAGRAIKGPTAKLMAELDIAVSPLSVATHYRDFIDGFIIDEQDADCASEIEALGLRVGITQTIMSTREDKQALAAFTLQFAAELAEHAA